MTLTFDHLSYLLLLFICLVQNNFIQNILIVKTFQKMFIITNLTNTFSVDCTGYMHLSGAVGREFLRRPSAGVGPCCPKGNRAGDGMACNNSDRRQWRKQEAVVGAAASEMQADAKQLLGRNPYFVSEEKATGTPPFCITAVHPAACSAAAAARCSLPPSATLPHNRRSDGRNESCFRGSGCPLR